MFWREYLFQSNLKIFSLRSLRFFCRARDSSAQGSSEVRRKHRCSFARAFAAFFPLPSPPPKKKHQLRRLQSLRTKSYVIPFKWKHSGRKFAGRRLHDTCIGSVSSSGASKKRGKARLARFRLLDFLYAQIFIEWERRFGMRRCFGLFYREYGEKSVRITGGGWHGVEA